jgi:CRP-like cAMP-binding protein
MSVDITERMLYLRQIPVAAMLPAPLVRTLAGAMRPRTLRIGRTFVEQGAAIDALLLLTDGGLRLEREGKPFGEIRAPQTIGFLSILARAEAPWTAVADVETRGYEIETDTLLDLFADHFELLEATLKYLAERLWFEFQELPEEMLGIAPSDLGEVPNRAIDLVEKVIYLRKTSGFASANVNALAAMARQLEEVRLPAGTELWEAGARGDRVFFVIAGSIRCAAPDGRSFRYGAGTGVGGIEALADRPRWYTATAESDLVGLWGHTDNLLDLFEQQNRMAMDFVAMLARAQAGLLARKATLGQNPLAVTRQAKKLGAIRYGA